MSIMTTVSAQPPGVGDRGVRGPMLNHRRKSLRPGQRHRRRRQGHLHRRRRPDRRVGRAGGRTIDATRHDRVPRRRRRAHARRRRRAQLRARADAGKSAPARKFIHTPTRRSGLGGMTPTTFATGYLYAGMGCTTVNEAAVPILSAKHTHEELHDIPIVDKSSLLLMANNEIVLDLLEAGEIRARQARRGVVSGRRSRTASRPSIPAASPRGSGARTPSTLHEPIEGYKTVTAGKIIAALAADLRRPGACRIRCTCTATTSASRATRQRRSRR